MSDTMTDFDPFADLSDDELDAMIEAGEFPGAMDAPHLDLIVAAYVFKLLSHIGYLPDCSSCVACEDSCASTARVIANTNGSSASSYVQWRATSATALADMSNS